MSGGEEWFLFAGSDAPRRAWWAHLLWVPAAAALGFTVPSVFSSLLRMRRALYLAPYVILIGALLFGYARWSGIRIVGSLRRRWPWGAAVGVIAGFFGARTVLMQSPSPAPQGAGLVFAVLWLGLIYGAIDALFLSVLPLSAAWRAFSELGWTRRRPGRIAAALLALTGSLVVIGAYHLGYTEFRGPQVGLVIAGVGIQSLLTLAAGSPLAVIIGHIAMHVTAVLYGLNSVSQLPPHY